MKIDSENFEEVEKVEIVTVSEDDDHSVRIYRVDGENYQFATALTLSTTRSTGSDIFGCESLDTARLAAGVFSELNHSELGNRDLLGHPDENRVPLSIAAAGQQVCAAWMKMFYANSESSTNSRVIQKRGGTRSYIAAKLGVEPDTISSYCNRVQWDGCIECGNENNIEKIIVDVGRDEVKLTECFDCGAYFVTPEDTEKLTHSKLPEEQYPNDSCVDALEPAVGSHGNDEFRLWCCVECGFYTAQPERHKTES